MFAFEIYLILFSLNLSFDDNSLLLFLIMVKNIISDLKKNKEIYFSILLLIIACFFSVGYFHPDEHFQLLEFAGLKLGLTEEKFLTWEFHERIRPTFQPFIIIIIYKFFSFFNINSPFVIVLILRLLSATLSIYTLNLIYTYFSKNITHPTLLKWFKIITFLSWFIIFFGVRFSSENWSGSLFVIGVIYYLKIEKHRFLKYIIIGVIFGISFLFRFQILFMVAGFYAWLLLIKKERIKNIISQFLGIIIVIIFGILLDSWFYGKFTISAYNYFTQNILITRPESYGIEPWYYYFKSSFEKGIPPLSIIYILSVLFYIFFKPKDILTWCIVPFLGIHFLIGHKELRFFFPILYLIPIFIINFLIYIVDKKNIEVDKSKSLSIFTKIFFSLNLAFSCIVAFRPMMTKIHLFEKVYSEFPSKTKIYYIDKTPYEEIHFYRRKNIEIIQVSNFDEIKSLITNKKYKHLVITNPENIIPKFIENSKIVYATFPKWLSNFNFNNWMAKSESYTVYELK